MEFLNLQEERAQHYIQAALDQEGFIIKEVNDHIGKMYYYIMNM